MRIRVRFGMTLLAILSVQACKKPPPPLSSAPVPPEQCAFDTDVAMLTSRYPLPDRDYCGTRPVNHFNAWEQFKRYSEGTPGCNAGVFFANPRCGRYGYIRGQLASATRDIGHDGDYSHDFCPVAMGTNVNLKTGDFLERELRSDGSWGGERNGLIHMEWQWCRHYVGTLSLGEETIKGVDAQGQDIKVPIFPARDSIDMDIKTYESLAGIGEWTLGFETRRAREDGPYPVDPADGGTEGSGHTELHELWFRASQEAGGFPQNRAVPLIPSQFAPAWDFKVSAFFPRISASTDGGSADAALPRVMKLKNILPPRNSDSEPEAWDAGWFKLRCRTLDEFTLGGGCLRAGEEKGVKVEVEVPEPVDLAAPEFTITVSLPIKLQDRLPLYTEYDCQGWKCGGCQDEACKDALIRTQPGAPRSASCDVPGNPVAYAGMVRCAWEDPGDLWVCDNCACDDPARVGATIDAPVMGCAATGLDPSKPEDRAAACEQVCGGFMCGSAPACRIKVCGAPLQSSQPNARLVARDACEPPAPLLRAAPAGDYRVVLSPVESVAQLGTVASSGGSGSFVEAVRTRGSGELFINISSFNGGSSIQFASMELSGDDFSWTSVRLLPPEIRSVNVTRPRVVLVRRAPGHFTEQTKFEIPAGLLFLSTRAEVDGESGGANVISQGPATGTFDLTANTFTLDAEGRDEAGNALILHLEGGIVNHPPIADPGPHRTEECKAVLTPVVLNAAASRDPDMGDLLTHFQWFEKILRTEPDGEIEEVVVGLATTPTATAQAELGTHFYNLHVYDSFLASNAKQLTVDVKDTTPPELMFPQTEFCLWPPNHEFALFTLGNEIPFSVSDACDGKPTVRILSVIADEAVGIIGSGNTAPDVMHGNTSACVRSERSGTGAARTYTLSIEARDASNNVQLKSVRIVVPHDLSGHPSCRRAEGLDSLAPRCSQ